MKNILTYIAITLLTFLVPITTLGANYTFSPSTATSYIAADAQYIPSPWLQDPSATDQFSVVADGSQTVSGSTLIQTVRDGWRWIQLGNPSSIKGYARTEVALTRQIATGNPFIPGQLATIDWTGYYTTPLPPVVTGGYLVTPGQIHDNTPLSPHYTLSLNSGTGVLYIEIHNLDNSFKSRTPIYTFNQMVNTSTQIVMYYKPNTAIGVSDGSFTIAVNGRLIFSEAGQENSTDPGHDYSKFGIYDFGKAIVDPANPGRGQSLSMVTTNYQVSN
jgi:hypothetical protein